MHYDTIVIGAGPAGCAAAYDLAAAGQRVLLLDRRSFPRVKACAGGLTVKTLRRLRYSIEPVAREVCTQLVIGRRLARTRRLRSAQPFCVMTVRSELDDYCLCKTIERGAEFRVVSHVQRIVERDEEIAVETSEGTWRAMHVVGADGANSVVRRLVAGFGPLTNGFAIEAQVAMRTPPPTELDFGVVEPGYGWLFPKRDHLNVGLYTSDARVRIGRDALADYARAKLGPVQLRHVVGHYIGLGGEKGRLASHRTLLVGDAAGLADPLLGEGIHNAIASGQAAAKAIHDARTTGRALDAAYAQELAPVLADLRACARTAARFYARVDVACRLLSAPLLGSGFLRGFSRGLTFSATTRRLPFLSLSIS